MTETPKAMYKKISIPEDFIATLKRFETLIMLDETMTAMWNTKPNKAGETRTKDSGRFSAAVRILMKEYNKGHKYKFTDPDVCGRCEKKIEAKNSQVKILLRDAKLCSHCYLHVVQNTQPRILRIQKQVKAAGGKKT